MLEKIASVGKPNKGKINLSELYEIKDLSKRFTVNKSELKSAIKELWNNGEDYERFFQKLKGNNSQFNLTN